MKKSKEIEYLLGLTSDSEVEFFWKMYPNGIDAIKNKDHAIWQIKNTIKGRSIKAEIRNKEIEKLKETLSTKKEEVKRLSEENKYLKEDLIDASYKPTPMTEDDALLLRALEHAGVDNWDGYSHAMEIYDQMKGK